MRKQSGAALFMALLMLMVLSFLGAVVLSGANMDLKMTSASASRTEAIHQAEGDLIEVISDSDLSTVIATMDEGEVLDEDDSESDDLPDGSWELELVTEVECRRSYTASSTNAIPSCRYARLDLDQTYGKSGMATTSVHAGLEQPLLD